MKFLGWLLSWFYAPCRHSFVRVSDPTWSHWLCTKCGLGTDDSEFVDRAEWR